MIEVHLYGSLRRHVENSSGSSETVLHLPADGENTVGQVFEQVGIEAAEVSHVFLNGRLLPRAIYPILLGYQLASDAPLPDDQHLAVPVQAGDRLGIFPRKMGVVVV